MEEKDKNYLPHSVCVEKGLANNFNVIPKKGVLSELEKELFEFGEATVRLKNCFGQTIEYRKNSDRGVAEIVDGIPKAFYSYTSNKKMYDEELRRE